MSTYLKPINRSLIITPDSIYKDASFELTDLYHDSFLKLLKHLISQQNSFTCSLSYLKLQNIPESSKNFLTACDFLFQRKFSLLNSSFSTSYYKWINKNFNDVEYIDYELPC